MKKFKKEVFYVLLVGIVFCGLTLFSWVKPNQDFSATERRELAKFPELSWKTIQSGLFMDKFEDFTLDQFPLREEFRTLKAFTHKYIFGQADNNKVYLVGDHISKLEYPYSDKALDGTINKFKRIYEKYIKDSDAKVYTALIPDKNYFLAEANGYLAMDYDKLYERYINGLSDIMTYIEIKDLLTIDDYYFTDTHWRQDCILDVAQKLAGAMGTTLQAEYEKVTLDSPFYGVYYGQLALPVNPDKITYMDNDLFDDCVIINHETQKEIPVYDMALATGRDPYEMFLNGSLSLITIENPNATTDKELVIFRDSFGSSISPLFVEGYKKITIVDARYMLETMMGNFIEFDNQDVLFLHCASVVNNESAFK